MKSRLLVVGFVFTLGGVAASGQTLSTEKLVARVSIVGGELIEAPLGWRVESVEPQRDWNLWLKPGDLILQINDEDASTLGPIAVASLLDEMGERDIRLKVQRGGTATDIAFPISPEFKPHDGVWFKPVPHGASEKANLQRRGAPAPDFKLQDTEGRPVSLSEFRGRWVLLDFWWISCGPCRQEMPLLNKLATEFPSRMVVLGVDMVDKPEEVRKYLVTNPLNFRVLLGSSSGKNPALRAYDFEGVPVNILVAPDGSTAYVARQIRNERQVRDFVSR